MSVFLGTICTSTMKYEITILTAWMLLFACASNARHGNTLNRGSSDPSLPQLKDLATKAGIFVGSASNAKHIHDDQEYDKVLAAQFSLTTPENACKWTTIRPTESKFNFTNCDYVVTTAEGHNQTIRGHNLCWGAHNPSWIDKYAKNSTALTGLLTDHVTTVTSHYKNRMYCWDVVNEAVLDEPKPGTYLKENIWFPAVPDYIDLAFKTAHAGDRSVKLFYNDYNCEVINAKSNAIYEMCKTMLSNGVPLHGFGIQAHFQINEFRDGDQPNIEGYIASRIPSNWSEVEENIKRFTDLGLEVHITEMDVSIPSDAPSFLRQQADVYRNMLKACLKFAPKCRSFETWGFIDKYSWKKNLPDYFDANFKPKPCFYAVVDVLNTTTAT